MARKSRKAKPTAKLPTSGREAKLQTLQQPDLLTLEQMQARDYTPVATPPVTAPTPILPAPTQTSSSLPSRQLAADEYGRPYQKWRVSTVRETLVKPKIVAAVNEEDAIAEFAINSGILRFATRPDVEHLGPCYLDEIGEE